MHFNIFILGAGRLGTTLGSAIKSQQFHIRHIYNHSDKGIRKLKNHFPEATIWNKLDPNALIDCDIVFLTVRDDILPIIIAALKNLDITWKTKTFIHTSGIHTSSILQPLAENGSNIASMHPMQTFRSKFISAEIFNGAFLACEGTSQAMSLCKIISKKLNTNFFSISSKLKVPYHLGATVASNLIYALIDIADHLFHECNITANKRKSIVDSLIRQVLDNYKQAGVKSALTGPLVRGDHNTVRQHIKYISAMDPEILVIYRTLSEYILNRIIYPEEKNKQKKPNLFK